MARHYGIPYMGSKQKLVDKIVPFILKRHPGVDGFYDLFGGGGSVSLYVVRKYPHLDVVYNERSKARRLLRRYTARMLTWSELVMACASNQSHQWAFMPGSRISVWLHPKR